MRLSEITVEEWIKELNKRYQTLFTDDESLFATTIPDILRSTTDLLEILKPLIKANSHLFEKCQDRICLIKDLIKRSLDTDHYWSKNKKLSVSKNEYTLMCIDLKEVCGHYANNLFTKVIKVNRE